MSTKTPFFTSKSFGSLAIRYQRPIALRPTLAGSLPLSTLKSQIFNNVFIILNNKYLSSAHVTKKINKAYGTLHGDSSNN